MAMHCLTSLIAFRKSDIIITTVYKTVVILSQEDTTSPWNILTSPSNIAEGDVRRRCYFVTLLYPKFCEEETHAGLVEEIFYSFEKDDRVLLLLEGWSFEEVVCSAFCYLYCENIWLGAIQLMLFSTKPSVSDSLASLLCQNCVYEYEPLLNKNILSANPECKFIIRSNLLGFLAFLRVDPKTRLTIVNNCVNEKSYAPLVKFLKKKNLEV